MKKLLYFALSFCLACVAFADDYIIQFVTNSGQHLSFRTSDIVSVGYDYHDQDSIDQAYADSVREAFVRDSLYKDSIYKDSLKKDSIGRRHTVGFMTDSIGGYSIFAAALKLTGLYDSLNVYAVRKFERPNDICDTNGDQLFCPATSRNGFTLFAEPDSVMKINGINNISELITYANNVYGKANEWYDYLAERGLKVSTGTDYTNQQNALNMFVAYHILKSAMPADELVYTRNNRNTYWNYCNGGHAYDYFETMLPRTLMKVWQPSYGFGPLFINRYITNNTLTDEVGTYGSDAMHSVVSVGVRIAKSTDSNWNYSTDVAAYNGYIHGIRSMLVYDALVPRGVLHERMRFDFASMLPEMNNNGWRFLTQQEASVLNGGGSGGRLAFPNDYFENIRVYTNETRLRCSLRGAYNAYMSDAMQSWGNNFDLAVKLPVLPSGKYEVRLAFTPMSYGSIVQLYFGDNPSGSSWIPYGIPLDLTIPQEDPRIGWTDYMEEEDLGIASDKAMRNRGYMRGPYSYQDHAERGIDDTMSQRRGTRNASFRKILGLIDIKQGTDNWLRVRSVIPDSGKAKFLLDYIEFVPVDVVNNTQYMEDWY